MANNIVSYIRGPVNFSINSLLTLWIASGALDFFYKRKANKINFKKTFGVNPWNMGNMPESERKREVSELVEKINDEYVSEKIKRRELAALVNEELTDYISSKTGERVETSSNLRSFGISKLIFPFASGACDPIGGDVYVYKSTGIFEPHLIAHEFAHRKGYFKELEAQVLAYLALRVSNEPVLRQAAACERLSRDIVVLSDGRKNREKITETFQSCGLREEVRKDFIKGKKGLGIYGKAVSAVMMPLYKLRMKLTGQRGLEDYDQGFTDFLYNIKEPI